MMKENNRKTGYMIIPRYGRLSIIFCLLYNNAIYFGIQLFLKNRKHFDLTTQLDRSIPFIPEWVYIYVLCYIFWAANYILVTREGKKEWYRYVTADMMAKTVCGLFFVFLPTTNVRPEVVGDSLACILMRYIYTADMPVNLFPSIHCLVSWFCFIGIRKSKKIPKWYIYFSLIAAILVCLSTQFTKQHYLIDVAGGVGLAELCYYLSGKTGIYKKIEKVFDRIDSRIYK